MKRLFIRLLFVIGMLTCLASQASAACTKRAYGTITMMIEYQYEGSGYPRQNRLKLNDYVTATGHYGGGCKTHVGREKARKRAKDKVWKSVVADYDNNWFAQAALVCRLSKRRDKPDTRSFYRRIERAGWIRVLSFTMKVGYHEGKQWGGGPLSVPKIRVWPNQRFHCTGQRPRQVND